MAGAMSIYLENMLIDGLFRNTNTPTISTWAPTTSYPTVGQIVIPGANFVSAGGKFLRVTTAGTSGSTTTLTVPAAGSTLTDGSVTWTAVVGIPAYPQIWVALATSLMTDDSSTFTEVSGGAYQRVSVPCNTTVSGWAGTQGASSTGASTGTTATGLTTSNNTAITFPQPSGANWGSIQSFGVYDAPTGGNLLWWGTLSTAKTVNNGDAAPYFNVSQLQVTLS